MNTLSISLFGKLCIRHGDTRVDGLDARKLQELLCYLLIYRAHPHSRENLANLLWSDHSTSQSKKYLRQALWQLQSAFETAHESALSDLLWVDAEWVQLNPQLRIDLDVKQFEEQFMRVQSHPGAQLVPADAEMIRQAIALYQGDLLEGWYQDWCIYERERFQAMYLSMLNKLLAYCESQGEYEVGLMHGQTILHYDRASERTHRRLMRLHYLAGDRTAALRQYHTCVQALSEELDVGPAKSTLSLYAQLCADRFGDAPSRDEPIAQPDATEIPLHRHPGNDPVEPGQILQQMRTSLIYLQHQIETCMRAFEQISRGRS